MNKEDLINIIGENKINKHHISAAEISDIMTYTNVFLEMDSNTLDYYYSINVNDLLISDMPDSYLENLKKEGWAFTEDKRNLIIYI